MHLCASISHLSLGRFSHFPTGQKLEGVKVAEKSLSTLAGIDPLADSFSQVSDLGFSKNGEYVRDSCLLQTRKQVQEPSSLLCVRCLRAINAVVSAEADVAKAVALEVRGRDCIVPLKKMFLKNQFCSRNRKCRI